MKCDLVNKKAKAIANPEAHTIYAQAQYIKHRTVRLAEKKLYRQTSKGLINASSASRKSHIKQRTPAWVDSEELWLIKEVYALATLRTKMFGFSWHVDHIVPLRGKLVSGLHVAINMRVIPANENLKKKNKFEVQNGY
jgi:hypothetical protein